MSDLVAYPYDTYPYVRLGGDGLAREQGDHLGSAVRECGESGDLLLTLRCSHDLGVHGLHCAAAIVTQNKVPFSVSEDILSLRGRGGGLV